MPSPGFLQQLSLAKILAERSADETLSRCCCHAYWKSDRGKNLQIPFSSLRKFHLKIVKILRPYSQEVKWLTYNPEVSPNACLQNSSLKCFRNPHWISNPLLQTKIPWQLQEFLLIQKWHLSWPVGIQQGNSCTNVGQNTPPDAKKKKRHQKGISRHFLQRGNPYLEDHPI